jgi:hypothetical protein
MTPQEQKDLIAILEEDKKMDRMRSFLLGVWHLFRDSRNEEEARKALEELKQIKIEPKATETLKKVHSFLDDNFDKMITYLKAPGVKRNSLSESGMRTLRRLEVEHDGFRFTKGRQNCVKDISSCQISGLVGTSSTTSNSRFITGTHSFCRWLRILCVTYLSHRRIFQAFFHMTEIS